MDRAKFLPPYLGAAYYPESLSLETIEEDIRLMKEAGINAVRMGEFAWSRMETEEGLYDFSWLHTVVDKLGQNGIATILGTPSCTPPVWLTKKYPEVWLTKEDGRRATHGARTNTCLNNMLYRKLVAGIVEKLGQEFGEHPYVVGWQLDNETFIYHNIGCCCETCVLGFKQMLRERFETIQVLNETWQLTLWSQEYGSFDEIPYPRTDIWHHPALRTAWLEFQSQSVISYIHAQRKVLGRYTKKPIGTDMMPFPVVDHKKMNDALDVVQFNHYNNIQNLWQSIFWFDYLRNLKAAPFWNTETSTCWGYGTNVLDGYYPTGFNRANSWMPIALGGEANMYWLWRSHRAGQELMFGSVVNSWGRPMHVFKEVQEISRGFEVGRTFLNGTRPDKSKVAIHFSSFADKLFRYQGICGLEEKLDMFSGSSYQDVLTNNFYKPMLKRGIRTEIIHPSAELEGFSLVFSPLLPWLEEERLQQRLYCWIESGGVWVAGPLTGIRDQSCGKLEKGPLGELEDWAGIHCTYQIPAKEEYNFDMRLSDGGAFNGEKWFEAYTIKSDDTKPWAIYTDQAYELAGYAAVIARKVGKGWIVLLGTIPTEESMLQLLERIIPIAGISASYSNSANVLGVARSGAAGEGLVGIEYTNQPGTLWVPRPGVDLLTGEKVDGRVSMEPYGVRVIRFI